ncbi:MAG: hypothetical protein JSV18_03185 [Candidatus Bathyarchaeota archaeon]|nr:MAG: hypothetical protein JSV18_03185 [Candidatus Bathyarchaeota archaeon]
MSTRGFLIFTVLQTLKVLSFAFWDPSHNAYLSNAVEEAERGKVFGNLHGLKGILVFPASLMGAYLYETFGFREVFTASSALSLLTLILAFRIREER